jgi:nucleoside-diphosphate-sugar epimerase
MPLLITGTSGRLGSALVQRLAREHAIIGLGVVPGPYTTHLGSVTDRAQVLTLAKGVDAILHTASLLPPHLRDSSRSAFVDIIVHGTLNLLEGALAHEVRQFIYTSTTSLYGEAMVPRETAELLHDPQRVILRHFPMAGERFATLGWQFPTRIDRVYVIEKAERELGYQPAFNFLEYLAEASHHSSASGCSRPG